MYELCLLKLHPSLCGPAYAYPLCQSDCCIRVECKVRKIFFVLLPSGCMSVPTCYYGTSGYMLAVLMLYNKFYVYFAMAILYSLLVQVYI